MKIIFDSYTDKGVVREINQDAIYAYSNEDEDIALFCVADGMGGHSDGEKASSKIIEYLIDWTENYYEAKYDGNERVIYSSLSECIEKANRFIYDNYNTEGSICGSTLTLLFLRSDKYAIFNIGDSRIYRSRRFGCVCLTKDDTWENDVAIREKYSYEELINRPEYGKLLKAVGIRESLILSIQTGDIKNKDVFMLCSDGLYKFCTEKSISRYLKIARNEKKIEIAKENLVNEALNKGTADNISCILVHVSK